MAQDDEDAAAAAARDEPDIERRRAAAGGDDGGFPDAFGVELGQSPEALRAGTPMRTADRVGDIFGDGGFGDGGFGDGGFGDGGFGDAPLEMGDADVPVGKTPEVDRRESRLLASTVLGAGARDLVALSPEAFAVPDTAPPTAAGNAAFATPAADAALADITPEAAAAAAAAQPAKKRKFTTRDNQTELTSPMIRAQLDNTEPIVAAPAPVPRSKRAMLRAMRADREPELLLRDAPLGGMCSELATMYTRNVDVAGTDAAADAPLDAFGADLLEVPGVGADFGGAREEFDFGGGFDAAYGDEFGAEPGQSTQQLLDDDGARVGDASALPPVGDDYYASDGEGENEAAALASAANVASAAGDAAATPGKPTSWSMHTQRMHTYLSKNFDESKADELSFAAMADGNVRKVVAATFFELLVLKSKSYIDVHQNEPYGDILVAKGKNFEKGCAK